MILPENILTPIGNLRGALSGGGIVYPQIIGEASGDYVYFNLAANALIPYLKINIGATPISGTELYIFGKNFINAPDVTLPGAGYIYNGSIDLPPGTYTMSYVGTYNSASFAILDKDNVAMVSGSHVLPYTFTIPRKATNARFYVAGAGTYKNIQIEAGTSPTQYETYNNGSYKLYINWEEYGEFNNSYIIFDNGIGTLYSSGNEYDLGFYNIFALKGSNTIIATSGATAVKFLVDPNMFLQWLYDNVYNP